jgi:hypothetical protein
MNRHRLGCRVGLDQCRARVVSQEYYSTTSRLFEPVGEAAGFQLQRKTLLKTHETAATATMMPFRTNHLSHFALFAKPRQAARLAFRFQLQPACIAHESLLTRIQPESLGIDMARHGVFSVLDHLPYFSAQRGPEGVAKMSCRI